MHYTMQKYIILLIGITAFGLNKNRKNYVSQLISVDIDLKNVHCQLKRFANFFFGLTNKTKLNETIFDFVTQLE